MTDDPTADLTGGSPTPLDGLNPEQDALLAALLADADVAAPAVPADLAARWDAAVAAEATARAAGGDLGPAPVVTDSPDDLLDGFAEAAVPPAAAATTVVPLQRSSRRSAGSRGLRFAGVAAAVAAFALVGGVVANQFASTSGDDVIVEASGGLPVADGVTRSNSTYTQDDLRTQVRRLITAPPKPYDEVDTPPRSLSATDGSPAPVAQAETTSGGGAPATVSPDDAAALDAFAADRAVREACITNLAQAQGVQPVAVDVGYYQGTLAVLVVLPAQGEQAKVDVFIVGPTCDLTVADVQYFARIDVGG